jgi:DNA-binding NarL/FixJ family response regulator
LLVADEDRLFAQALRSAMASDWFEVVGIAGTGRETVDLTIALDPDVVLLDLPDPDGYEALRRLRDHGARAKTIVLGGHDGPAGRRRATELGAAAFLSKGQPLAALANSVQVVSAFVRAQPRVVDAID